MGAVQEPVESFAMPPDLDLEVPARGRDDAIEHSDLDPADLAGFDPGHELPRDTDGGGHVTLPSIRPDAQYPDRATDPATVHRSR